MSHIFKLTKILGPHLYTHETGEIICTNQMQEINTVIGLYFTDVQSNRGIEFNECLINFYKQKRNPTSFTISKSNSNSTSVVYKFHVVMILFDENEKTVINVQKKLQNASSTNVTPFLIFNDDLKSKLIQEYLIRKYSVQEVPTLIIINANTGTVINFNAVRNIYETLNSTSITTDFPWPHSTFSEIISGKLIANSISGSTSTTAIVEASSVLIKNGIRGLLFSAYWCPPCKLFSKQLQEVYQKLKDKFNFQVIYVSSDRSQESFDRFMSTMPWYAIPFTDGKRRSDITSSLNVKAIPTLVIIDSKDNILTTEGRSALNEDLDALDFPWKTNRLVEELHDRHSSVLNHNLCLICFIGDDTEYEKAETILQPIALEYSEMDVEEAFEIKFFIATDSELAESLRLFIDLDESISYILILDIPNFRYAVTSAASASSFEVFDEKSTKEFLQKFQNSEVKYRYIQSRFI